MILILSNDLDTTTGDVIDILLFKYYMDCIRINEFSLDSLPILKIEINNKTGTSIYINNQKVKFVWCRKTPKLVVPSSHYLQLENFYKKEYNALLSFFDLDGALKPSNLGSVSFNPYDVNKLHVLSVANEVGLKIPETIIVNNKVDYTAFLELNNFECITKPIQSITIVHNEEDGVISKMLTAKVLKEDSVPDVFFPSLFQKEILKKYEIRVFYIAGKFYSLAIFSQSNDKTRVDFRNYDNIKPNRLMNYKLPEFIEAKIEKLMNRLKLKTGSIDIIYSTDNDFVFLEVNPSGLLGHFTEANVDLNKVIAQYIKETVHESK